MGEEISGHPVVLVTGSTDGLGRKVARQLVSDGAHVIVHGRNRDQGAEAVLNLVRSPDFKSGQCFPGLTPARADDRAYDPEARKKPRDLSRELTQM